MKKVVLTVLIVLVLEAVGWLVFIYSGAYNISTTNHDNAFINWALDKSMTRSVQHHAKKLKPPPLTDPALVQEGFRHYREMCVSCHGAPGAATGEIAKGLWPEAPNLAKTVPDWTPAQLFWLTKEGVKFTAMPAWGPTHNDARIWSVVAFLEKLPHLSPADYQQMEQNENGSGPELTHQGVGEKTP